MSREKEVTRYQRSKELFLAALEIDDASLASWLSVATDGDQQLRREVEMLLNSHRQVEEDDLFEQPIITRPVRQGNLVGPGSRVGPWLLGELIGTGGMGAVYRAERADGAYERTVAIKLLRSDFDATGISDRFGIESNTLARLEHPNIARFYDAGFSSEEGSFLVMEFVNGISVTEYVVENNLTVAATLQLFIQICSAVSYAHQNLVVHRDLKPSNILVGSDGNVKLLDFGIALLLDSQDTKLSTYTGSAMTPAYAAPEQIRKQPVTTATDTYSLGIILFEMLTAKRPYELAGMTPSQLESTICEHTPPYPSALASSSELRKVLGGDLDTIVMKALEKDPAIRYSTTQALAADVQRYLDGEPVHARGASSMYRLAKFASRNRIPVASAVLVLVAILFGIVSTTIQARRAQQQRDRAEERFDIAREATGSLLFEVHDAIANLAGSTPAREKIVGHALTYLDRLNETAVDDIRLRIDIANAYRRVGDVLGNPSNNNLGRVQDAISSYRSGLAVLENAIPSNESLQEDFTTAQALLYEKLADVTAFTGAIDSALIYLDTAIARYDANFKADPGSADKAFAVAIGNIKRGDYTGNPHFPNSGDLDLAESYYRASLGFLESIDRTSADTTRLSRYFGLTHERLGTIHAESGELELSRESYERSMQYREKLWRANPNDVVLRRDAGIAHEKVGLTFQLQGELDKAWAELQIAHRRYSELVTEDPQNANAQITLAVSEMQLGALMASTTLPSFGDREAARLHYNRARAILQTVIAIDASNVRVKNLIDSIDKESAAL